MASVIWIRWIPSPLLLLWFLYGSLLWPLVFSSTLPQAEESTPTEQAPGNSSSTVQGIQASTRPAKSSFPFWILILVVAMVLVGSLGVWFYKCRRRTRSKNAVSYDSRSSTPGSSLTSFKFVTKETPSGSMNSEAVSVVKKPNSSHRIETPSPARSISSENSTATTVSKRAQATWTQVPQSKRLRLKSSIATRFPSARPPSYLSPHSKSTYSVDANLVGVNSSEVSNMEPIGSLTRRLLEVLEDLDDPGSSFDANPNRKHMAPPSMMSSIIGATSTTPLSEVTKPKNVVQPLHPPSMLPSSITGPTSSVVTDKGKGGVPTISSPKAQVPAGSRSVKPHSIEVPDFTREAQKLFGSSPQDKSTIGQPTSLMTSKVLAAPSQVHSTIKAKDTPLLRSTSIVSVRTKDSKPSPNLPKSKKN